MSITTIVFDLGGVLINWDPKNLYVKIFENEQRVNHFLDTVCTLDWNAQQDAGRSLAEATEFLVNQYPQNENEIRAYYNRWEEMLDGSIDGTVDILKELKKNSHYRLLALTNWSRETFPRALELFEFLHWFEGIVVSGEENLKKPDHRLYQVLIDRYQLMPEQSVFIDDTLHNVAAACELGMHGIHFQSPGGLQQSLRSLGIQGI